MNREKLGDSYDVVKKSFCRVLSDLGYKVFIRPMFTGDWGEGEQAEFHRFLDVTDESDDAAQRHCRKPKALFVDPDTGVWERRKGQHGTHVFFDEIAESCGEYEIVLVFDQSFAWNRPPDDRMQEKLAALANAEPLCHALYYKSHACFLFASHSCRRIHNLLNSLSQFGIPEDRLVSRNG